MEGRAVRLRNLRKVFATRDGQTEAVAGVRLDVADGEFFAMLGPSGSGKTTVLRMIAGFETPTSGSVELHGEDVTRLAPFERDVHTVFQDYALFPHMTVEQNVAYALKVRKVPKAQRLRRAAEALERVRLAGYGRRKTAQLSGGQRQRVALARALVGRPRLLMLDEPLGALDLKLREQMQLELKALQREVGITFVYVTHDQDEALTMSDRIAVFRDGRVEQTGTPADVYERPATPFVADFVGTSNLLAGDTAEKIVGVRGPFSVRPEKIRIRREREREPGPDPHDERTAGHSTATGTVDDVVYLGGATRFLVDLDAGGRLTAVQQNLETSSEEVAAYRGARVRLEWHKRHNVPVGEGT